MGRGSSKAGGGGRISANSKQVQDTVARIKSPSTKQDFIDKMEVMVELSKSQDTYTYSIRTSEWENYGKSRTYLKIAETRASDGKPHGERDYGYYDNKTNTYVKPKSSNNLNGREFYSISGGTVSDDDLAAATAAVLKRRKSK